MIKKILSLKFFSFILIFINIVFAYNVSHYIGFGKFLTKDKEYKRSIIELKKAQTLEKKSENLLKIENLIISNYILAKKYESGIKECELFLKKKKSNNFKGTIDFLKINIYITEYNDINKNGYITPLDDDELDGTYNIFDEYTEYTLVAASHNYNEIFKFIDNYLDNNTYQKGSLLYWKALVLFNNKKYSKAKIILEKLKSDELFDIKKINNLINKISFKSF